MKNNFRSTPSKRPNVQIHIYFSLIIIYNILIINYLHFIWTFGRFWNVWTYLDVRLGEISSPFGRFLAFGREFGLFGRKKNENNRLEILLIRLFLVT